jgi:hypothetical protein
MTHRQSGVLCAVLALVSYNTQAVLIDKGNGLIYDTDLDITWLANANSGGLLTWDAAVNWADSLETGSAMNWRLPTADNCVSTNTNPMDCSAEFNRLFYNELGGTQGDPLTGDVGPFADIQNNYWTSEERVSDPPSAWYFWFGGSAGTRDWAWADDETISVWAVHDGNIATPIPAAIWLFGSGLLGMLGLAYRRRSS